MQCPHTCAYGKTIVLPLLISANWQFGPATGLHVVQDSLFCGSSMIVYSPRIILVHDLNQTLVLSLDLYKQSSTVGKASTHSDIDETLSALKEILFCNRPIFSILWRHSKAWMSFHMTVWCMFLVCQNPTLVLIFTYCTTHCTTEILWSLKKGKLVLH